MTKNLSIETAVDQVQEYFNNIKKSFVTLKPEYLKKSLGLLPNYIELAKKTGQLSLAKKLEENLIVMVKERVLLDNQIIKVITGDQICKYIDSIKNHYVKFCELEHFPRIMPKKVLDKLNNCKSKELFDEYYVLFTDYTDEELLSEQQKEKRKINKDPILFGAFKENQNRFYFIADWIDEYCDITLDTFLLQLKNVSADYEPRVLVNDTEKYINDFLKEYTLCQKKHSKKDQESERSILNKKSIFKRLLGIFKK